MAARRIANSLLESMPLGRGNTRAQQRPETPPSRILGIDPGLQCTGYGLVFTEGGEHRLVEAGVVRPDPQGQLEKRLMELHDTLRDIVRQYTPQAMAIEQLYSHYDRPTTAILMGHARGVICLAAALEGVPVYHYPATNIKKILTGNGRASKDQMQSSIQREFRLASIPEPHDVADALAVALCHAFSRVE